MTQENTIQGKFLQNALFMATAIAIVIYLVWRALYTLPFGFGLLSMVVAVILLVCEIVSGFEAFEQYLNMVNMREPEMPVLSPDDYPDVDVFVTTHNESADLLLKTANACLCMDYPDKRKMHVYLCDDTNRSEIRLLAEQLGVGYIGLAENEHAKAGNLNNALSKTDSPLVATFDADMIPRKEFLMETIPYFSLPKMKKNDAGVWVKRSEEEIDPEYKIGFIQTPQSFYSPDLFQYNLYAERRVPNEQDYFFREINVGRNRSNAAIFVGSNAVLSREALREVGGIAINTITEDFETGLRIQEKGYSTYAISKTLAHGMTPHTIGSLLSQRERWQRGCVQSLKNVGLFFNGLTLGGKISYFACLLYWWTFFRRFVFIMAPIVSVLFNIHVVECTLGQILLFWLPYYILSNRALSRLSGSTRNQHWNNLIDTIMCPYLISPILLETLGISQRVFKVTTKKKDSEQGGNINYAYPHILLLAASALALVLCLVDTIQSAELYNLIIIFWLIINGKNLLISIFFMQGRTNFRKADRFYASMPVTVRYDGRELNEMTSDVSETGMNVSMNFPHFLPNDETFAVEVSTENYRAAMRCEIIHVSSPSDSSDTNWHYCMRVTDIDPKDKLQYLQIVYDREHSLPERIMDTLTVVNDLSINIERRLGGEAIRDSYRKLPRVVVGMQATVDDQTPVLVVDFNYKFVRLSEDIFPDGKLFHLDVAPSVRFELMAALNPETREWPVRGLYHVLNYKELLPDPHFRDLVASWVEKNRQ